MCKRRPLFSGAISPVALNSGAVLSLLRAALEDDRFTRNIEETALDHQRAENEVLGLDDPAHRDTGATEKGSAAHSKHRRKRDRFGLPSAASRIRMMHHRNRNLDEKRWVALDAVVNPTLYHHVTPAEAEEMRWDVSYFTRLDREDILRVLSLPIQVHLALPFLHTPDEINAHELLGRYTLGIAADHFSRSDKNSQDLCMGIELGGPENLMTPAERGLASMPAAVVMGEVVVAVDNHSAPRKSSVKADGSVNIAEEADDAHSSPRTLACMRRSAQVQLKSVAERNLDEAVWVALDKKLRPEFYDKADEAAGDRDEESHKETDAKEDARHAWLRVTPTKKVTSNTSSVMNTIELGMAEVDYEVDGVAGAEGAARQEFIANQVAEAVGDAEVLKQLTSIVLCNKTSGNVKTRPGLETQGGIRCTDRSHEQDAILGPMGTAEIAAIPSDSAADSLRSIVGWRSEGPRDDGTSGGCDARLKHAPEAPEGCTSVMSEPLQEEPWPSVTKSSERNDFEPHEKKTAVKEKMSASHRLNHVATRAFSLFLVREEETPIGRDMTRSLAMLQEATLRLGRGQTKVMRGLNQQVAMRTLFQTTRLDAGAVFPPVTVGTSEHMRITADALPLESGDDILEPSPCGTRCTSKNKLATNDGGTLMTKRHRSPRADVKETAASIPSPGSCRWGSGGGTFERKDANDDRLDTGRSAETTDAAGGAVEDEKRVEGTVRTGKFATKTFGSWQMIHPASLGLGSQERMFDSVWKESESTEERIHPASFRVDSKKGGHSIGFRKILIRDHSYNSCRSV